MPGLVIVAGAFLAQWLFLVAALLYLALVLITYLDEAEAHRVAETRRRGRRAFGRDS